MCTSRATPASRAARASTGVPSTPTRCCTSRPLRATLENGALLPDPVPSDRQRRRASACDSPRFLRGYDETLTGDLLPRGTQGARQSRTVGVLVVPGEP